LVEIGINGLSEDGENKDPASDPVADPGSDDGDDKLAAKSKSAAGKSAGNSADIDWKEAAKLADEITEADDVEDEGSLIEETQPGAHQSDQNGWPPGSEKKRPSADSPDPFSGADDGLETPAEQEGLRDGAADDDMKTSDAFDVMQAELERVSREVDTLKAQVKENLELAQRKQAELVNFRRRNKQETEAFRKRAIENLLVDLLPVIDTLEKAVQSVPEDEKDSALADGLRRTLQLFVNTLTRYNVNLIQETMVPFDPEMHSCLYVEETDEYEDNTVIEIYQNGFMLADRLIRPAMVKLSKRIGKDAAVEGEDAPDDAALESGAVSECCPDDE